MQNSHPPVEKDIQRRLQELRLMIRSASAGSSLHAPERLPIYDLVDLGLAVCEGLTHGCVAVSTVELLVEELQEILSQCEVEIEPADAEPLWVNAA
ncbi:MAG TPA: hypothetical protein VGE07_31495 [Herpetosiphonaceae bacterium]